MKTTEIVARGERCLRPLLARLPAALAVRLFSRGRSSFLASFSRQRPSTLFEPASLGRVLWGIPFRSPLMNAAGMFKNGEGYAVMAHQGAGAYLAGTTTSRPRSGNRRRGIALPFAPYPHSGAASNWLGLPNPGHRGVAERLKALTRHEGCPIGASVAACPDPSLDVEQKLEALTVGMRIYEAAGVDFLEMNESCPNTEGVAESELEDLDRRLIFVAEHFLSRRQRVLPVVVKFSCDTAIEQVPALVDLLLERGFDGVNFGNTSIAYDQIRPRIAAPERPLFDHFTQVFQGGVSGRPLKESSFSLACAALEHLETLDLPREFHVIRTGGIENATDVIASERAGLVLNQWYTGYFDAFSRHGHAAYQQLYRELAFDELGESGTDKLVEW